MREGHVKAIVEEKANKIIACMLLVCVILIAVFVSQAFYGEVYGDGVISLITLIRVINGSLSAICIISCLILYKKSPSNLLFTLILIYLSLSIGVITGQFDFSVALSSSTEATNYMTISSAALRVFIAFSIIFTKLPIYDFINKHRIESLILVALYTIVVGGMELIAKVQGFIISEATYVTFNVLLFVAYVILALKLARAAVREKKVILASFCTSAFLLAIKAMYTVYGLDMTSFNIIVTSFFITYLCFFIIILGVIIELYLLYQESKHLNNELLIFYNLANNNRYTNMFICDKNLNISYINKKIKEEYEYKITVEQFKEALFEMEDVQENIPKILLSLEEKNSWRGIIKDVEKNEVLDVSIQSISSESGADGNEYLVSYINISDNLKLESEVELSKLNDIKRSEFISILSHELKTPLNIFNSTIQLLDAVKKENIAEVYYRHKDSLTINCRRMLRLINNIIDTTKIESGAYVPNFGNYEVVSMIEDIVMSTVICAKSKKIEIVFDTNTEECFIKCDPIIIEKIVLNLVSNAIKYSEENTTIRVDFIEEDDYVRVRVKDRGIGISPNLTKKIFDKFIRCDNSLKRLNEGSGIGLSIVKSLVEIHDGHILVDSILEKGSIFEIQLPLVTIPHEPKLIYKINGETSELELSDIY